MTAFSAKPAKECKKEGDKGAVRSAYFIFVAQIRGYLAELTYLRGGKKNLWNETMMSL